MTCRNQQAILFFVKYPTAGHVKTRLAKTLGDQAAARVYRQLAGQNYSILRACGQTDLIVFFDPPEDHDKIQQWLPSADEYLPQQGDDLGQRLTSAFAWAFAQGYKRVAAYGSDTLHLTTEIAQQSFAALCQTDVVIGPAKDGGYYLIGLSANHPQVFVNISWSTSDVLAQTYQIMTKLKLKYQSLSALEDLDEIKSGSMHEIL
jgi:rSAM/selenodomain-associated transferase 1